MSEATGELPDGPRKLVEQLESLLNPVAEELRRANDAREAALPACRKVIQLSGRSIKSVHRLEADRAAELADEAQAALLEAHGALQPFPALYHAGFLHDAEKEYVEARTVARLVAGEAPQSAAELGVLPQSWMKGLAEAASEMRRHLLDRLRAGELDRGEELLGVMDDIYDVLMTVDFPDAITSGLRRSLDALRAVLERSRGDVTTTVLQTRLQRALENASSDPA